MDVHATDLAAKLITGTHDDDAILVRVQGLSGRDPHPTDFDRTIDDTVAGLAALLRVGPQGLDSQVELVESDAVPNRA